MLDYNTIFFVACQDRNVFLFHFVNFTQTWAIFHSRLTSKNIPFCFLCAVVFNRDHCGESCAPSCNPSSSQKAVKNCCPIYKKSRRGHLPMGSPRRSSYHAFQLPGQQHNALCCIAADHSHCFSTSFSLFKSSGLAICSFMPVFFASCTSSAKAFAVMAMMGTFPRLPASARIAAVAS